MEKKTYSRESLVGNISIMIKFTFAFELLEDQGNDFDIKLINQVNEFVH